MLIHEYLQTRPSIQAICENIIDNRAVVLFMTFICVVATETIICLLWTYCKNRVLQKVGCFNVNDTWYGMTYKEEAAAVKDSFKIMLENGFYGDDLFSDL